MSIRHPFLLLALLLIQTLSVASVNEHIITLEYQYKEIRNFGFYVEKVINATGKERLIGFVEKKVNYQKVPAFFTHEISVEVADFLARNLTEAPEGIPLIVRVDRIQISETYNGVHETATAKVYLTFVTRSEDSGYYKLLTARVTRQKSASMGITKSQPGLIAEAITQCFADLYNRQRQDQLLSTPITEKELYNKPESDEAALTRLLAIERNKAGIYKTFYDFQNNTPDTSAHFEITYKPKQNSDTLIKSAKIYNPATYEDFGNVWGFCDGRQNFIRVGNKFLPLQKDEDGYYLMIKVYDDAKMFYAGYFGGLVGTGIAAATTPKSKARFNLLTGKFDASELNNNNPDDEIVKVVFYASRFNSPSAPLEIIVNDTIHCTLPPNTWYKYGTNTLVKAVDVTVRSGNGQETTTQIIPKPYQTVVYLCIGHRKKPPSVNKIPANKKNDYESVMTNNNRVFPPRQKPKTP